MLSPHAAPTSPSSALKSSEAGSRELWSVPPLSAAASADILHFLKECSLDISRIHELESRLSTAMLQTESESISQLYQPQQQAATDRIAQSIDDITEKVRVPHTHTHSDICTVIPPLPDKHFLLADFTITA